MNEQQPLFDIPEQPRIRPDRPRDEVWDTLTELFGPARTRREHGRRNAAAAELREAEATPDEIRTAYRFCKRWKDFTEMALCGWLSISLHEQRQQPAWRQMVQDEVARQRERREQR